MDNLRIFIVHGRNAAAVEELSKFIRAIGLTPWTFADAHVQMGGSQMIDDVVKYGIRESAMVVALITPDEHARLRPSYERDEDQQSDRVRLQSRPNVFYEMGLAFALASDTNRVLIALTGQAELPSDFRGRVTFRLRNDTAERRRLRGLFAAAKCPVNDSEDYLSPAHGDFAAISGPPIPDLGPVGFEGKKIDLVLGPGGVRCLAFAGAMYELEHNGYSIASICGVSAGAVLAAARAAGLDAKRLMEAARNGDVLSGIKPPSWWRWIKAALLPPYAATKPVEASVFCKLIDGDPTFAELDAREPSIPLGVAALDLSKACLLAYTSETHPEMRVSEALTMCTAVPLFYPPRREPVDRLIVDAAIQTHLPLWLPAALSRNSRNRIVALSAGGTSFRPPRNFSEYLSRLFEASVIASDSLDMLQSRRLVRIRIPVTDYGPLARLSASDRNELVRQGQQAIQEALANGVFESTRSSRVLQHASRPSGAAPALGPGRHTDEELTALSRELTNPHDRAEAVAVHAALRYGRELQQFSTELE